MEDNNLEIPVIEISKIKVYIKVDNNKVIRAINSSIFIKDLTEWIKIDEGYGDRYSHAQSKYFEKGLIDSKGRYNYKYDKKIIDINEEEKNMLFPIIEKKSTELDILKEKNEILERALIEIADVQSKESDNRNILESALLDLANIISGGK